MKMCYLILVVSLSLPNLFGQEDTEVNSGSRILMVNAPTYFGGIPKKYTDSDGKTYYKYLDGVSITEKDFKQSEDIQMDAGIKFGDGNFDGAIADASRAIYINPQNYHAYYTRGNSKNNKSDFVGAMADLDIAVRINPKFTDAYLNLGKVKFNLKDYEGAIETFSKAIELDSMDDEKFAFRGYCKEKLKDYKGAIVDLSKAISINPRADHYYSRGFYKYNDRELQSATADFSKAIEINPYHESALHFRGNLRLEGKDFQGAMTDYSEVIKINPNNYSCIFFRGMAKEGLRDIQGAIEDCKKALEIKPDYLDAWNNLKRLAGDKSIEPARAPTLWLVAVGIDNYQHGYLLNPLGFTVSGAHKVADLLRSRWNLQHEYVSILTNQMANRQAILNSLEIFTNPIKVGKDDMVIFYFSGHGRMAGKKIGICSWDYASPQNLITDEEIVSIIERSPAKHKICLIEACKSNSSMSEKIEPEALEMLKLYRKNITSGLAYITSTRPGSESYSTGEEGGFFTKYLLEALEQGFADANKDRIITVEEAFSYLQKKVSERTSGDQVPEINKDYNKSIPIVIMPK